MTNIETTMKYINTVLLSIMSLILLYGVTSVKSLATAQNNMRVEIAIIGKSVLDHNVESEMWKDKIEENEDDINDLKLQDVNTVSREEALAAIDQLRTYVEKNYQRK